MPDNVIAQIHAFKKMTVGELRQEWMRLYGEASSSRNRDFLWKRLAWRVQERAHGGLSDRAKERILELAPAGFIRACPPRNFEPPTEASAPTRTKTRPVRDIRLPSPGTVVTRTWHGRDLRLLVMDDGFELDGVHYQSLSEAARAVTGAHWNGKLFWGLTRRTRNK